MMKDASEELRVPADALPLILLQRPMLQWRQPTAERLGIPLSPKIRIEAVVRRRAIRRQFAEMMAQEYRSIRAQLPARPTRILDVGCGVAAIDALLFMHYGRSSDLEFFLLDRTELIRRPRYGFSTRVEFYNSLAVATQLLHVNGISPGRVDVVEVPHEPLLSLPAADLIVSLASWGFHYPVSTYLEQAWNALAAGGTLILDIRAGVGEERVLASRFTDIQPICELWEGKATRYCARKGSPLA
jgi:SAM-dependent methyltransferase